MSSSFYKNLPGNDNPKKKGTSSSFKRRIQLPTDTKKYIKDSKPIVPDSPSVWLVCIVVAIIISLAITFII